MTGEGTMTALELRGWERMARDGSLREWVGVERPGHCQCGEVHGNRLEAPCPAYVETLRRRGNEG